jgi:transcriptional regulator with XRE-family HTH domain
MKQSELAALAHLSVDTISRLEAGTRSASVPQLMALAEALDVSPRSFIPEQAAS